MGSYGSLASYVAGLAARFTRIEQLNALNALADEQSALYGASVSTLRNAVRTAEYEFYWDSQHLATVASIVDQKVKGGASATVSISFLLVAFGVLVAMR